MRTIIALFNFAPILMISLLAIALSGLLACYKLATQSDQFGRRSLKYVLASALLVPAIAFLANNFWVSSHSSIERLALNAVPMNHNHLESMYFVWWCVMSAIAWILVFWRKRSAA